MNVIKAGRLQPVAACCGIFNVDGFCALMLPLFPHMDTSVIRLVNQQKSNYCKKPNISS